MAEYDKNLGMEIHELLKALGLETPMVNIDRSVDAKGVICEQFAGIMNHLGLDRDDDSLKDTPKRVAKMYCDEIFTGLDYGHFPKSTTVENKMHYQEMVAVDNINVMSLCEHHFLPFVGKATIGYVPGDKVLGLSKFNRVVDFFARRPQIQERLTEQVAAALRYILDTDDVAVVIRAEHYCVRLRGVRDAGSETVTSRLSGKFREVPELRQEFLALSKVGK